MYNSSVFLPFSLKSIIRFATVDKSSWSCDEDKIEPYEGKLYFSVMNYDATGITIELSDISDGLEDSDYERFGLKFEKDFPEYWIEEEMESVFSVYLAGSDEQPDIDELRKKLNDHPDYELGDWESMEE